jgi:hypothetical protein
MTAPGRVALVPSPDAAADAGRPQDGPVPILYIGGMGRSGSTLLEVMVSRVPGAWPVGELRYLWERGPVEDVLCSCGARFSACPFWREVGDVAFGGWGELDVERVLEIARHTDRHRYLPLLLWPRLSPDFERRLSEYGEILRRLYSAIRTVSGCEVVVDSTKDPPYAYLLRAVDGLDVRLVHLVRDSRGVAYSWTKSVVRPEVTERVAYMARVPPARMALRWVDYNLLFHGFGARSAGASSRMFLRYESLISDPRAALRSILAHGGLTVTPETLAFLDGGEMRRAELHTISGNPLRFEQGTLKLRLDEEWKRRMKRRDRLVVLAVTWPFLVRYGYLGRAPRTNA